jgi:hypothetical protein
MATYNYPTAPNVLEFGERDALTSGNSEKLIKGEFWDYEFRAIETSVNGKLEASNPAFTGTLTGPNITITGTLTANKIDGGTFTGVDPTP